MVQLWKTSKLDSGADWSDPMILFLPKTELQWKQDIHAHVISLSLIKLTDQKK
jgi:hypothetical protein